MAAKRPYIILAGAALTGIAAGSGLAVRLPVICPLRRFTGIPCGSCGLTHAFTAICHGHLWLAEHDHLASLPLFLLAIVVVALSAVEAFTGRDILGPIWRRHGRWLVGAVLVLILAGWAVNLTAHFGHPVLGL